jgi:hypothetical protein
MQTSKIRLFKMSLWLLALAAASSGALALLSIYVFPTQYTNCERNTKYLNGGVKVYDGKKYNIVLCGDGGDENFMHDKMRMQIFSESGGLLAQRTFYVDWQTSGQRELVYGDDHLIYIDPSKPNDFKQKVRMPPTWFDWVRARLPLVD